MKISKSQAIVVKNDIAIAITEMIDRTIYLTDGQCSTLTYLTPEIDEEAKECFEKICKILNIEDIE